MESLDRVGRLKSQFWPFQSWVQEDAAAPSDHLRSRPLQRRRVRQPGTEKLFERGRDARPWEVVPLNVWTFPAVLVNAIKGLFVDFFSRITRTSWRTGVDVGTARQVARGGTRGITAIIIFIRTIWWVVSLSFPRLYILRNHTSFFLSRISPVSTDWLGRIWHWFGTIELILIYEKVNRNEKLEDRRVQKLDSLKII